MTAQLTYVDRLKIVLTDERKMSPYLTKELKFSQGVANRILNNDRIADERILWPLRRLENVRSDWLLFGEGQKFHVEAPATEMDAEELVRAHAMDAAEVGGTLHVVTGTKLAAMVFSMPVPLTEIKELDESFSYLAVDVIGGALTFDLAMMLVASGLPVRSIKLTSLNDNLIANMRAGEMGTFKLFGSKTFGKEGLLSNAADFPLHMQRLAAEPPAPYLHTKAAKSSSRTKKH